MATSGQITEAEAVATAGVSARTLQRFQESGYLEVSTSPDGTRRYLRAQLLEIFGAADAITSLPQEQQAPASLGSDEEGPPACFGIPEQFSRPSNPQASSQAASQAQSDEGASVSLEAREIQRLKNLVSLQERILDMKESEVADLRSQRDWLKSRIERLEEKAERDQILLLSETQTIRKLVSINEGRRSALHNILEWLGIAKQPEVRAIAAPEGYSNSDTVEVKGAANS